MTQYQQAVSDHIRESIQTFWNPRDGRLRWMTLRPNGGCHLLLATGLVHWTRHLIERDGRMISIFYDEPAQRFHKLDLRLVMDIRKMPDVTVPILASHVVFDPWIALYIAWQWSARALDRGQSYDWRLCLKRATVHYDYHYRKHYGTY